MVLSHPSLGGEDMNCLAPKTAVHKTRKVQLTSHWQELRYGPATQPLTKDSFHNVDLDNFYKTQGAY